MVRHFWIVQHVMNDS